MDYSMPKPNQTPPLHPPELDNEIITNKMLKDNKFICQKTITSSSSSPPTTLLSSATRNEQTKVILNFSVDRLLSTPMSTASIDVQQQTINNNNNNQSIMNLSTCYPLTNGYGIKYAGDFNHFKTTLVRPIARRHTSSVLSPLSCLSSGINVPSSALLSLQQLQNHASNYKPQMINGLNHQRHHHHHHHHQQQQQQQQHLHSQPVSIMRQTINHIDSMQHSLPTSTSNRNNKNNRSSTGNDNNNTTGNGTKTTNANTKRKRSWSRAVFSHLQRKGLEIQFKAQTYITKPERKKLAANLGLTDAQVKVWFQNRRMKMRNTSENKTLTEKTTSNTVAADKIPNNEKPVVSQQHQVSQVIDEKDTTSSMSDFTDDEDNEEHIRTYSNDEDGDCDDDDDEIDVVSE